MVDVEEAIDAARASVIEPGVLEPAASRVLQRGKRTADRVDLITPASEGIVDVITHFLPVRSSVPNNTLALASSAGQSSSSLRQLPSFPELPETHLQVDNKR